MKVLKMKRLIDYMTLAGGGLFLFSACDGDLQTQESLSSRVPIEVYTNVGGDEATSYSTEGIKATLLFWDEAGINAWLQQDGSNPAPAFVRQPEGVIDDYTYESGTVYSTGVSYRSTVYYYAAGFAPSDAFDSSDNYQTLTVKEEYQDGKTDFLSCDVDKDDTDGHSHKGSLNDRFTKEEHELQFRHLTSRIEFNVERAPEMIGKISVNNVSVTVKAAGSNTIPTSFKSQNNDSNNPSKSSYVVSVSSLKDIPIVVNLKEFIPETGLTIGSCYVWDAQNNNDYNPFDSPTEVDGEVTIHLDVAADFYSFRGENEEPVFLSRYQWDNVQVPITTTTGNRFYPGYEYVVTITFEGETILLQGIEKKWENGGTHYIPITPPLQDTNNSNE